MALIFFLKQTMQSPKNSFIFLLNSLFFCVLGFSQLLPPIIKYHPKTYGAGNQNWMISQNNNHFLYFANNEGLLECNGSSWHLYKSPNETIMRSVQVVGDVIFTGCYMEFGFWKKQNDGHLKYTSVSALVKSKIKDDEQFWNILNFDNSIVFQSLSRLYIYDLKTKKIKIIDPKNNILKAFKTQNGIYFQTKDNGLFEIENGEIKLLSGDLILKNNKIINIYAQKNQLVIQTQYHGLFSLFNGVLSKIKTDADAQLLKSCVYSSILLKDGSFALGTVSDGIFIISPTGKLKYHITQNKGLSNNTVLSMFEDADLNLWIGLDNGINCINLTSKVKNFSDDTGILGTVYCAVLFHENLYIGTNQGLFFKSFASNNQFEFVNGTKGQVWALFVHDDQLFCGHDSGTFLINNNQSKNIFSQSGTWKFDVLENNKNLIIQGNYDGLSVLEKIGSNWVFRNKIQGFDTSSKFFEKVNNQIFVSHEYKGIYRLDVDSALEKASNLYIYNNPSKGKNSSLVKFNNQVYYAYKNGIFKLNIQNKLFEKQTFLSKIFENNQYTSGKLVADQSNKIWLFSKNYIHYFTLSKFSKTLKQNAIPIPSALTNSMLGYENIYQLSNADYLIGTTDGFYTIDVNDMIFKNYNVMITEINYNKINKPIQSAPLNTDGLFGPAENNFNFNFTVAEYNKYINPEYQYLLEGFQNQWSDWSSKSNATFKNLPPGNYVFKVQTRNANTIPEKTISYSFTIKKPWFATNLALFLYFVLFLIGAFYVNKAYENYYKKQKQKLIDENNRLLEFKELENEKQLMKIKNEELTNDMDSKNRELAVSTMSLIKKNELLALIKDDLKNSSTENNGLSIKSVISTITRNINEEDTWSVFKEAFDNADKDFLKKAKAAHKTLTPNDLRLCAYLRLNLSSKEIAPLLNISVRSVEIKRYRLRKKMDLSHEQGLVEYILSI